MKSFTIKEDKEFRLRVEIKECLAPRDLRSIHFVREQLKDNKVESTSVYEFFLYPEEIMNLQKAFLVLK